MLDKKIAAISLGFLALGVAGGVAAYYVLAGKGLPELYGDDPKKPVLSGNADYYRVIYMKFGGAGDEPSMLIRHAVFRPSGTDNVAGAVAVLRAGGPLKDQPKPAGNYVHNDFEHFGFRTPQRVYVFVDNKRVGFQKRTPLSFTPYGGNVEVADAQFKARPYTHDKNFSFYNAGFVSVEIDGESREVLKFDNLFRDIAGGPLKPKPTGPTVTKAKYSMNFNLNMCRPSVTQCDLGNDDHVVPFVVDPDTGNGMGPPPPY